MSCGKDKNTGCCVCDILADIAERQRPRDDRGGCDQALRELVNQNAAIFNTIPVQLICADTFTTDATGGVTVDACGSVFIARGFRRVPGATDGSVQLANSTWFRVNTVDEDKCCAELELLCTNVFPIPSTPVTTPDTCLVTITPVFQRTGIFVTVDLCCFCGVTCHPAVNATTIA